MKRSSISSDKCCVGHPSTHPAGITRRTAYKHISVIITAILTWICYIPHVMEYCMNKIMPRRPDNFPPGPSGIPIFGVLPSTKGNFRQAMTKWRAKYGDIVGILMGTEWSVVISDINVISQLFRSKDVLGRPPGLRVTMAHAFSIDPKKSHISDGIVFTDGPIWKDQRQAARQVLVRKNYQDLIQEQVEQFVTHDLQKLADTGKICSHDLAVPLGIRTINVGLQLVIGKEPKSVDDIQMKDLVDGAELFLGRQNILGAILPFWPWLRHLPFLKQHFRKVSQGPKDMMRLVTEQDTETKEKYAGYMNGTDNLTDGTKCDLVGAGMTTTSTAITFAMYYLMLHPNDQRNVQTEIDEIYPDRHALTYDDRKILPRLQAFIMESMRLANIVYTVPHVTEREVTVKSGSDSREYVLPQGTTVYMDCWNIMQNKAVYDDPKNFKADRFLVNETSAEDEQNNTLWKSYIPFSTGRRSCLGEYLAKEVVFVYIGNILQNYDILPPEDTKGTLKVEEPDVGFHNICPTFYFVLRPRIKPDRSGP